MSGSEASMPITSASPAKKGMASSSTDVPTEVRRPAFPLTQIPTSERTAFEMEEIKPLSAQIEDQNANIRKQLDTISIRRSMPTAELTPTEIPEAPMMEFTPPGIPEAWSRENDGHAECVSGVAWAPATDETAHGDEEISQEPEGAPNLSKHEVVQIQVSTDRNNILISADRQISVEYNRHDKRSQGVQGEEDVMDNAETQTDSPATMESVACGPDGPEIGAVDVRTLIGAWENLYAEPVDHITEMVTDATEVDEARIDCRRGCCTGYKCTPKMQKRKVRIFDKDQADSTLGEIMSENHNSEQDDNITREPGGVVPQEVQVDTTEIIEDGPEVIDCEIDDDELKKDDANKQVAEAETDAEFLDCDEALEEFLECEEIDKQEEENCQAFDLWEFEDVIADGHYSRCRAMDGWQKFYQLNGEEMGQYSIHDILQSSAGISGWSRYAELMDEEEENNPQVMREDDAGERVQTVDAVGEPQRGTSTNRESLQPGNI